MSYLLDAKNAIRSEIQGITEMMNKLDNNFNDVIDIILSSKGRVVMCGMGKSGHIGKKIFATFVSTGTPSLFMHPAEAYHGDLGMIKKEDIFFAISNSGETSEVSQLLPFIKQNGNTLISMTGNINSTIAQASDYHLDIGIEHEACPLNLAPTTSTTVSLVLGDAIAISLMKARRFKAENFATYHPGGALGRKLLSTVKDYIKDIHFVNEDDDFINVVSVISNSHCGVVAVGDALNLKGIITDGDLRKKLLMEDKQKIFLLTAKNLMTTNPKIISSNVKCSDANYQMEVNGVNSLIVVDNNIVVGIYNNFNRKA
ncbi:KpsF/GutQ family sugar-phosphate isomerase [Aliivibrio fischeri]|uniref:KpsF/GutQ family sugar-phosphate isomerase n=1 Tax=Aliivibrio fischeri TaxID=668 RepID=UPI0012DA2DF7|nr:KpsF/GutQ family sugar-phosphate isomerase [Aliivibrio fischeri]MUL05920.1 KpsF/GutQ family sugar-phosphate isomerase [Aliivibrio fischeri]